MNLGFYPYKVRKRTNIDDILFHYLTEAEIVKFKKWARDNYKPYENISGVWHPVVQVECAKMNEEFGNNKQGAE